ncbi:MAG TPA: hypothetical protein VME23_10945 [Terracidiphilus sp.]|nr:hypothetical protein [Terracidiphilus sp.]
MKKVTNPFLQVLTVFAVKFFGSHLHAIVGGIQLWGLIMTVLGLSTRGRILHFSFNAPSLPGAWHWPWLGYLLLLLVSIQILASLGTLWLPEMNFAEKKYNASEVGAKYRTTKDVTTRVGWKKNLYASLHLFFGVVSVIWILSMVTVH